MQASSQPRSRGGGKLWLGYVIIYHILVKEDTSTGPADLFGPKKFPFGKSKYKNKKGPNNCDGHIPNNAQEMFRK